MIPIKNLNDILVTQDVYQGETPKQAFIVIRSIPDIIIAGEPEVRAETRHFVDIGHLSDDLRYQVRAEIMGVTVEEIKRRDEEFKKEQGKVIEKVI